jgi:hypothetical protein
MPTYQPNIPVGTTNLNVDYSNIQGNFSQLNNVFQVDHTALTNSTGQMGYHTVVHFIPPSTTSSNPTTNYPPNGYTATSGYGQLFAPQINDGLDSDEALFFLSGGNKLIQLTSNILPVAPPNPNIGNIPGVTFLPGGIIVQWITVPNPVYNWVPTAVTLASLGMVNFPNALYFVLGNVQSRPSSTNPTVNFSNYSTTGFTYTLGSSGSHPIDIVVVGH